MIFRENRLLADDSHEIVYLIFLKIRKDVANLSSAAVMIGTLRVNHCDKHLLLQSWRFKRSTGAKPA